VVPAEAGCVFGPRGRGNFSAKVLSGDIALRVTLTGIDPACANETLCLVVSIRASQDGCASTGSCSTITQTNYPLWLACCDVTEKGRCSVKSTVQGGLGGLLTVGNQTEISIGEVGMQRIGGGTAFGGGLLLR
jgi:hypothetical protein